MLGSKVQVNFDLDIVARPGPADNLAVVHTQAEGITTFTTKAPMFNQPQQQPALAPVVEVRHNATISLWYSYCRS